MASFLFCSRGLGLRREPVSPVGRVLQGARCFGRHGGVSPLHIIRRMS